MTWLKKAKAHQRLQKVLAVVALFFGTAPLGGVGPTRRPIDSVSEIRERLLQSDSLSSEAPPGTTEGRVAQWPNWRNFWPDWPNWRDWANWPNWRDWRNW
jgi:hypothetical protein